MRYPIFTLGCVKAGFKAFLASLHNSLEASLSLLDATGCVTVFHADPHGATVRPWLERRPALRGFGVPSVDALTAARPEPFAYRHAFDDAQWDPLVVLHTSGSTGIPKPITVRQGSLAVADGSRALPELHGSRHFLTEYTRRCSLFFRHMPMFHAATVYGLLAGTIYYGTAMALGPPEKPLTPQLVVDCLEHSGADACVLPPSIIEDMAQTDEGVAALQKQNFVIFGGGEPILSPFLSLSLSLPSGSTSAHHAPVQAPCPPPSAMNWSRRASSCRAPSRRPSKCPRHPLSPRRRPKKKGGGGQPSD